jgi:hypothetical protein
MSEPTIVEFDFQVRQVKSMADHSINITLNIPEYEADKVSDIIKRIDEAGTAALVFPEKQEGIRTNGEVQARSKRKSEWTTEERPGANNNT